MTINEVMDKLQTKQTSVIIGRKITDGALFGVVICTIDDCLFLVRWNILHNTTRDAWYLIEDVLNGQLQLIEES